MPERPSGHRWVSRMKNRPITAKAYHLYADCGMIRSLSVEQFDIIEVDDRLIDLCGLHVCTNCDRRSHVMSYEEVTADWLTEILVDYGMEADLVRGTVDESIKNLIERLDANGYRVRQVRKVVQDA